MEQEITITEWEHEREQRTKMTQGGHGFFDMLSARAEKIDSLLCVGLDPHERQLGDDVSANGAKTFSLRLIEATSDVALAYKPNSAFFERFGVSVVFTSDVCWNGKLQRLAGAT